MVFVYQSLNQRKHHHGLQKTVADLFSKQAYRACLCIFKSNTSPCDTVEVGLKG